MADTRTLKLSLLADVQKFLAGMDKADKSTKSFSSNIGKYSKAMAKSFAIAGAAAGAYALKLGVDGVKAAVADELSQTKLATALKNTTKATDKQIAATEDYIKRQQIQFGIADTKLRPALANLARATGSITEAQKLNNIAIDISAATGRDLESVSLALGRAYQGNFTSLKKLGIPLDENIVKTKDFDGLTKQLTDTFGGSAKANTETYAGQLAILQERFGEIQEDIGAKLIPKLKGLLETVNDVAKGFSGDDPQGLSNRARELAGDFEGNGATSLGGALRALTDSFGKLFTTITDDGDESTTTLESLANSLESVANGINAIASAYQKARSIGGRVLDFLTIDPGEGPKFADSSIGKAFGYTKGKTGGVSTGGTTIVMNGVIDGESARRSIEKVMQDSSRRTGAVNLVGGSL